MKTSAHHLHRAGHLDVAHVQHHPENKGRNRTVSTTRLKVERELGRVRVNGVPSVVNGKPVPARRATAQCVGVLADKRNSAGD